MAEKPALLIVDDDEDVLKVLSLKLERSGRYTVATASDAQEALVRIRANPPDLIVCDIDMPEMDGGELAASLRQNKVTATVPIVFLSALVSPEDTARGTVGGWPMLSKRGALDDLVRKIEEMLAARTT